MTLHVGKGQVRVKAKLCFDGIKDVPARELWELSGSHLIHCLDNCQVITQMSEGGNGLLKWILKRCKKAVRDNGPYASAR
jgi:hypothetical protein